MIEFICIRISYKSVCLEKLIRLFFGSDRSPRSHNLRPFVRPSGSSLSRAVNLHLSKSESTQRAICDHSESSQSNKIRVNTVGAFKTLSCSFPLHKQKISFDVSLLIISILLSILIVKNFSSNFLINTILISSALYLFFITLRDFFKKKFKNLAQNTAHFGFSLLILSILFNSLFSSEIITNLKVGETYENTKAKIVFESISQKEEKNYKSVIGNFIVQDSKGKIENLSPELRIYNQPNITTSEADIKTTLLSDKFIVINLVQNQEFFNVRYQVKPFMLWIWISVILISFGGLISFVKK